MSPKALTYTFVAILDGLEIQWLHDKDEFAMEDVFEEFLSSISPPRRAIYNPWSGILQAKSLKSPQSCPPCCEARNHQDSAVRLFTCAFCVPPASELASACPSGSNDAPLRLLASGGLRPKR